MNHLQVPSVTMRDSAMRTRWLASWRHLITLTFVAVLAGCATPAQQAGPSPDEVAKQERSERANSSLAEGLKQYDSGNYDAAMKGFLVALDSGLLTQAQQLNTRKHMAFIHCVSSRESSCREEFEKAFAIDAKFDLSAAEAGHPTWGPVFRSVKADVEARRSGRSAPAPATKLLTAGEKLLGEGMTAYDAADYNKAVKSFQDALKETLSSDDQIKARKFTAFSYCLTNRMTLCRQEFEKILQTKADFDLLPAEAGHPSWGPSFRQAKARAKAPSPATTPAKK